MPREWVKLEEERAKKGSVSLWAVDEMLVLRWRYQGKRFSLALSLPDTAANRKQAKKLANEIELDVAASAFDVTLAKYRPEPIVAPVAQSVAQTDTIDLWDSYTLHRLELGTSPQSIAARYHPIRANLERFGRNIEDENIAKELIYLLQSRQSSRIVNQNLSMLRGFGTWAVKQGHWTENYFASIRPLKVERAPRRDKPFTAEEVKLFLSTIKTDPNYFSYHDFCYCLFHLGCRPSELIGLRWGRVDLVRHTVTICESLSRGDDGKTAGYARKRKSTKTGGYRILPLNGELVALFQGRYQGQMEDDLVFTAPKGGAIDDHNFSQRCWRSICQKAGIPYRPPYIARHTCLSHIVEQTGSLAQAAAVAGHANLRMVSDTYGHLVNKVQLPKY